MAVALIMDFAGASRTDYEEVIRRMDLDGHMGSGGLAHVAGEYAGGWRVIDVWEDMESFERFRDEKIIPHTQAVGMGAPQVRAMPAEELMRGRADRATFAQCVFLDGMDLDAFHVMDRQILADGERPADVVWHVHGPVEGGVLVVDTWNSREARDRFIQERVMPAMASAGVTEPPAIEDMDVSATLAGGIAARA